MDFSRDDARNQQQDAEWREAQSISITPDLASAAAAQLLFLAAVDRHRALYADGPVLRGAIRRYKNCWLPLLAEHQQQNFEPDVHLVVPLDCEWIWHCHRLNPVQYKKDCEAVYGRILDSANVGSTTGVPVTDRMKELWARLYGGEPFEIEYEEDRVSDEASAGDLTATDAATFDYDLAAAVKRQSSFFYQVSRPMMHDRRFVEAAIARYKGFLHLIRRSREKSIRRFTVPTYDIDLIWHSHQLQPLSYCNDLRRLIGRVLEHDDVDSDRSKGKKLDVGFTETTKLWEETFGSRYWRAGAMYRGTSPSPVVVSPCKSTSYDYALPSFHQQHLHITSTKFVEVFLEVVDVRNAPDHKKGTLFISFKKDKPDLFLGGQSSLNIQSETGKRDLACFQCDPTGDLILTLWMEMVNFLPVPRLEKNIGTTAISLQNVLESNSELAIEKWFELKQNSRSSSIKPIFLHVAVSCTLPSLAPYKFHSVKIPRISRFLCFSPFSIKGQQLKHCSRFIDSRGNKIIKISMRLSKSKDTAGSSSLKQVVGFVGASGKNHVLAEFDGNTWSFMDLKLFFPLGMDDCKDGYACELQSEHQLKLFHGRKLAFENMSCNCVKQEDESHLATIVHFSGNEPYGKAVALINIRACLLKVNEEWFVLPGLVLTFILWSTLKGKKKGICIQSVACSEKATKSNASPVRVENPGPNASATVDLT